MKLVEVKGVATTPEYADELPAGTVLKGRDYGHAYVVTDQKEVVRLHDGKTVDTRHKTSEYDVIPEGATMTFTA